MFRKLLVACVLVTTCVTQAVAGEYHLTVEETVVNVTGKPVQALGVNGQIPGPLLRFKEGEEAVIHVTNKLDVDTSLHWHGLLLPGYMDGVPGFGGYPGIKPGETFTYRFTVRQNGTYWYHSHSGFQEQAGVYGPLVIDPAEADLVEAEADHVILLSDFTDEDPSQIIRNLKIDAGYYNYAKRTLGDFVEDSKRGSLSSAMKDRVMWGQMRMDATDLADVAGYTFLMNGKPAGEAQEFLFKPGQKTRLRFINGSAMTFFDVRIPGLKMTVVQADGRDVQPVPVDEFRIAVAETYDVIVEPTGHQAFSIIAESLDRTGYALGSLTPHKGMKGLTPKPRPRTILSMEDMNMEGMDHDMGGVDHSQMDHPIVDHVEVDHREMTDDQIKTRHMDHGQMNHDQMDHNAMASPKESEEVVDDNPIGWASGFPKGAKVLSYADLKSIEPNDDLRPPGREITVNLTGNMERYIWSINGKKYWDAEPIELVYGERVKMTFVNDTMMAHPMHLHGMFVELDNGQTTHRPEKHVVNVPPGKLYSVLITADEEGEWAFHCHLLYHMASGMKRKVVVAKLSAEKE